MKKIEIGLNTAVDFFHTLNQKAGWWDDPETGESLRTNPYVIGTKLGLIHSEISEALEAYRKDTMDDHLPNRRGVAVELADAFIRLFDICGVLGIDNIGTVIIEKHNYNQKRADHKVDNRRKKGGKKF